METSPLALFPFEVRELIYQNTFWGVHTKAEDEKRSFVNVKPKKACSKTKTSGQLDWFASQDHTALGYSYPTAVLQLCQQIRAEATPVYWNHRTLCFMVDSPNGSFKEAYSTVERVAAICCIRDSLIALARRQPCAIRYLKEIVVRVYGFAITDMPEIFDIISQVQMLLGNWRTEALPTMPMFLHITEIIEFEALPGRTLPLSRRPVQFYLPVHNQADWQKEVHRGMKVARLAFSTVQALCDIRSSEWSLGFLEWCLTDCKGDYQGCALQRGCHCERHVSRSYLSFEPEKKMTTEPLFREM